jgi:hypothetical protein
VFDLWEKMGRFCGAVEFWPCGGGESGKTNHFSGDLIGILCILGVAGYDYMRMGGSFEKFRNLGGINLKLGFYDM